MRYVIAGLVFILAALSVTIGYMVFDRTQIATTGSNGNVAVGEAFGVDFNLVDHNGAPITQEAFRGKPSAVFFGFTHCPEICPTTLYEIDRWLEALGEDADKINAYFVTIDPERDTPEVLGDYITSVTQNVIGITGDPEAVREMARGYAVFFKRIELEDNDYTMDHTASIFLLDSAGRFRKTIAYGEVGETALAKLRDLAGT